MGNGESTQLLIELDKGNGVPQTIGEPVKGKVIVRTNHAIRTGELIVSMIGTERVFIPAGIGTNKSSSTSRAEIQIFTTRATLCNFASPTHNNNNDDSNFAKGAGTYEFHFALPLPASIPATMTSFQSHNGKRCVDGFCIQYQLCAKLNKLEKVMDVTIQSASPMIPNNYNIMTNAITKKIPCEMEPISIPLKNHYCNRFRRRKKKGTAFVTVGAKIDNSHITVGGQVEVQLACLTNVESCKTKKKNGKHHHQSVDIRLIECSRWCTNVQHENRELKTLACWTDIRLPINETTTDRHPNMKNRRRLFQSNKDRLEDEQLAMRQVIKESWSSDSNVKLAMTIPLTARESYHGQLFQIWHMIEIRLKGVNPTKTSTNVCSKSIPLHVGRPRHVPAALSPVLFIPMLPMTPPVTPTGAPPTPHSPDVPVSPFEEQGEVTRVVSPHPHHDDEPVSSQTSIPIVCAVTFSEDEAVDVNHDGDEEANVIVLGEDAIVLDVPLESLEPVPAPAPASTFPHSGPSRQRSLSSLLSAMESNASAYDLIRARMQDPEWRNVLETLSPADYGKIVSRVRIEMDQTCLAEELALSIQPDFTCAHAAAAVRNAADWNRSNVAQRLLPLCSDVVENHSLIRRQLNAWDRVVTGRDFKDAIAAAALRRKRMN